MSGWAKACMPPTICLPTTRRSRCSIPVADGRRPDVSGSMPANNAPGVDRSHHPPRSNLFAPDRKVERPVAHLANFKGVLHVDGYAGFEHLAESGDAGMLEPHTAQVLRGRRGHWFAGGGRDLAADRGAELYVIEARLRRDHGQRCQTPA
jgi:Transposase IS66 family